MAFRLGGLQSLFGEYTDEIGVAIVVSVVLSGFVIEKPYRKWRLYKKIKGKRAEKTPEEERYPEIKDHSVFPDLPPEESEEK